MTEAAKSVSGREKGRHALTGRPAHRPSASPRDSCGYPPTSPAAAIARSQLPSAAGSPRDSAGPRPSHQGLLVAAAVRRDTEVAERFENRFVSPAHVRSSGRRRSPPLRPPRRRSQSGRFCSAPESSRRGGRDRRYCFSRKEKRRRSRLVLHNCAIAHRLACKRASAARFLHYATSGSALAIAKSLRTLKPWADH